MTRQGFQGVAFREFEAGLLLKLLAKEGDQALVHLERLDRVTSGEQTTGEGAKAGSDFLNRFRASRADGLGDLGGQAGLSEEVLSQLAERAESAGGQDLLDPGGVQSWRSSTAWSWPAFMIPRTSSAPLP